MIRVLSLILILQFLAGFNAGWSFRNLDHYIAGFWAGSVFLVLGLFVFFWALRRPKMGRRLRGLKSPLLWTAGIHTFVSSLPLFVMRLVTPREEAVTQVMGFSMASFHQFSVYVFWAFIAATAIELLDELYQMIKKRPKR